MASAAAKLLIAAVAVPVGIKVLRRVSQSVSEHKGPDNLMARALDKTAAGISVVTGRG